MNWSPQPSKRAPSSHAAGWPAQAAVAAAEGGLEQRFLRVVPAELETRRAQLALQQADLLADGLLIGQRGPLEGRVRLGHERAHPDAHGRLLAQHLEADLADLVRQVGDGLHVVERLRRMADHEVDLDRGPAAAVDLARRVEHGLRAIGLLITSRRRSVAASGAKVKPERRRPFSSFSISSTLNDSMRRLGRPMESLSLPWRSTTPPTSSPISL